MQQNKKNQTTEQNIVEQKDQSKMEQSKENQTKENVQNKQKNVSKDQSKSQKQQKGNQSKENLKEGIKSELRGKYKMDYSHLSDKEKKQLRGQIRKILFDKCINPYTREKIAGNLTKQFAKDCFTTFKKEYLDKYSQYGLLDVVKDRRLIFNGTNEKKISDCETFLNDLQKNLTKDGTLKKEISF